MKYKVNVSWTMLGEITVEADTEAQAKEMALVDFDLPTEVLYLSDSIQVDAIEPVVNINLDEPNIILYPVKED